MICFKTLGWKAPKSLVVNTYSQDCNSIKAFQLFMERGNVNQKLPDVLCTPSKIFLSIIQHDFVLQRFFMHSSLERNLNQSTTSSVIVLCRSIILYSRYWHQEKIYWCLAWEKHHHLLLSPDQVQGCIYTLSLKIQPSRGDKCVPQEWKWEHASTLEEVK